MAPTQMMCFKQPSERISVQLSLLKEAYREVNSPAGENFILFLRLAAGKQESARFLQKHVLLADYQKPFFSKKSVENHTKNCLNKQGTDYTN